MKRLIGKVTGTLVRKSKSEIAIAIVVLAAITSLQFSRVKDINPAILGDEWIYLVTSRHIPWWDQQPSYDFGNYLFNVIFGTTSLCGDQFYTCAKGLNAVFFFGFLVVVFFLLLKLVPFWPSVLFSLGTAVSPIAIYVSMYLPEMLYFFLISLVALSALTAIQRESIFWWVTSGTFLGLAALAKPHALISLMAFGIFYAAAVLLEHGRRKLRLIQGSAFLTAFVSVRMLGGFILAGPKGLNFLTSYGAGENLRAFVTGNVIEEPPRVSGSLVGSGALEGALGLFGFQSQVHLATWTAIAAGTAIILPLAATSITYWWIREKREPTTADRFALLALIWAIVLTISIVLFTGWITGSGDDHTLRVLLRYYDFAFILAGAASIGWIFSQPKAEMPYLLRFPLGVGLLAIVSYAFTSAFPRLTVQIADAPFLAGLIVDGFVFNTIGLLSFVTILTFMFWPSILRMAAMGLFFVSMGLTGYQTFDQYQEFRGELSPTDRAGIAVSDILSSQERSMTLVVGPSNFEAKLASFWMDALTETRVVFEASKPLNLGSIPGNYKYILVLGTLDTSLVDNEIVAQGDGYILYSR